MHDPHTYFCSTENSHGLNDPLHKNKMFAQVFMRNRYTNKKI